MIEMNKYDNHITLKCSVSVFNHGSLVDLQFTLLLAAEPIGLDGPWPANFLALVAAPISGPPTFLGDVNFFFLYIAIMTGENLQ